MSKERLKEMAGGKEIVQVPYIEGGAVEVFRGSPKGAF